MGSAGREVSKLVLNKFKSFLSWFNTAKTRSDKSLHAREVTTSDEPTWEPLTPAKTAKDVIPEMISGKVQAPPAFDGNIIDKDNKSHTVLGKGAFGVVYRAKHPKPTKYSVQEMPGILQKSYVIKKHTELFKKADKDTADSCAEVEFQKKVEGAVPIVGEHFQSSWKPWKPWKLSTWPSVFISGSLLPLRLGAEYIRSQSSERLCHHVMMEHGGQALSKMMEDKKSGNTRNLDEDLCRVIGSQLLQQLASIHKKGGIHRDIKPDNILINHQGKARLADFGTSETLNTDDSQSDSSSGQDKFRGLTGTANYMAPEIANQDEYSEKIDCWSMGIMFAELLTGKLPRPAYVSDTSVAENAGYEGVKLAKKDDLMLSIDDQKEAHNKFVTDIKTNKDLTEEAKNMIVSMIAFDPKDRVSAEDALNMPFFKNTDGVGKKHFQLQIEHQEKFQLLACTEKSLVELKNKNQNAEANVIAQNATSKFGLIDIKSVDDGSEKQNKIDDEIELLESNVLRLTYEVKCLQKKMELEDLKMEREDLQCKRKDVSAKIKELAEADVIAQNATSKFGLIDIKSVDDGSEKQNKIDGEIKFLESNFSRLKDEVKCLQKKMELEDLKCKRKDVSAKIKELKILSEHEKNNKTIEKNNKTIEENKSVLDTIDFAINKATDDVELLNKKISTLHTTAVETTTTQTMSHGAKRHQPPENS